MVHLKKFGPFGQDNGILANTKNRGKKKQTLNNKNNMEICEVYGGM